MSLKQNLLPPLPPSIVEQWRRAVDAWRGPPSELKQPLFERLREGADLDDAPDALVHARAPAPPPPAPATCRGRPSVYDWECIEALDDTFRRTYFAKNKRVPTWKRRHAALVQELGDDNTPHIETLKRELRPR